MAQRQSRTREAYMRKIDFMFYREKEIREAVEKARLSEHLTGTLRMVRSGGIPDPTALQATKNLTPLRFVTISDGEVIDFPERWLEVIEKTYNYCARQKDCRFEVAKRRYKAEDYRKTCRELNISNVTRCRLMELVRIYAALQAVQLGLIQV